MTTRHRVAEIAQQDDLRFVEAAPGDIWKPLGTAIEMLLAYDHALLRDDAGERAVCHRLAIHLEFALNETDDLDGAWVVDCEYNRDRSKPKMKNNKYVTPDLVVHERGTSTNHLVLEAKRASSPEKHIRKDLRRLIDFADENGRFAYDRAVFLLISPREISQADGQPFATFVRATQSHAHAT